MLKVYQNVESNKMVISKAELVLEGFKEVVACSTDAAQEKHVPVVTKRCGKIKVDVGSVAHPMTAEHFIEWVAIETEQGYQVKYLTPDTLPVAEFSLSGGDKLVAVYAYCNLHGLWKDE